MSSVNASPDPMQNESKRIKKKTASDDVSTVNDSIMMFVGQLPREMDEEQLTKLFEEFGSVDLVNIIRNRKSQESQGCCFVTFSHRYDAFRCQAALNNHKRFPGLHRPVQMKPADSESETKLFIGMLPSVSDDNAVKEIFAPFGNIVDCTVLKDQNGASKRCGFVTYSNRTSAIKAINALNQNYKVPGSNHYIVVKFADKDQSRKRSSVGPQHDTSLNNRMQDLFKYTNSNNDTSDNGFKDLIILYDLLEKYGIVCNGNLNLQRLTLVLDAFADLRSAGSNMRNMDNLHDIGMPSHMNDPLQRALNSEGSNSYNSMQQSQDLDSPSGGFGNNFQRKRRQDFS